MFNPLVRLPDFLVGVAIGKVFLDVQTKASLSIPPILPLVASVIGLVVVDRIPASLGQTTVLTPLWATLLYSLACRPMSITARFLASSPMVMLGEASYALYLLHVPLWFILAHYLPVPKSDDPLRCWTYIAFYACCVIGISLVAHRYFEEPARKFIRSYLSGKSAR
jgi:peptidoglycan/LPS O-acetylase OafA/YrhL